jgi:hypothetical protein
MHGIPSVEAAANLHCPSTLARNEFVLLQIMLRYPQPKEALPRLKQSHTFEQLVQREKAYPTSPSHEQIQQLLWQ